MGPNYRSQRGVIYVLRNLEIFRSVRDEGLFYSAPDERAFVIFPNENPFLIWSEESESAPDERPFFSLDESLFLIWPKESLCESDPKSVNLAPDERPFVSLDESLFLIWSFPFSFCNCTKSSLWKRVYFPFPENCVEDADNRAGGQKSWWKGNFYFPKEP